jgi:hypothetical protein
MEFGVFQTPENNPSAMTHYVEMYKEIRQALNDIGIDRKRIGLIGLDCSTPGNFVLKQHSLGIDLDPYIDAYSVHHYNLRIDYLPPITTPDTGRNYFINGLNAVIEQDDKLFLDYARSRNKPFWALEMGTFYYGKFSNPEGTASLDATITVAEGIIRAINVGITSICIWSLMNPNTIDGHWAVMGITQGGLIRYNYPFAVYGLLSNHFAPNARVIPIHFLNAPEIINIHATALENPNEEKTIMIVNDHVERAIEIELELPENWPQSLTFIQSLVDKTHVNELTGHLKATGGKLIITCPPFSLMGLKYKP